MRRTATNVAIGAAFAIGCGSASAARLDYTIDAGIEDNDNIALTTDNEIRERFLRAGLGFLFTQDSSTFQSNITGRLNYRDYRDDRFASQVDGTLSGRFNWVALPERLHFTVDDSLSVQPISTLAPDTPDNRQQVNVLSVGPTLFYRLGQTFRGQTELRLIDSSAETTDQFNSRRTALALRAIKDFSSTSLLSLNLQGQRIDFDRDVLPRDYDRYEAFARFARKLNNFDVAVEGGYSWLKYRDWTKVSEPLARANLSWHATERSEFKFTGAYVLSDSASEALAGLTPGVSRPNDVLIGNSQVSGSAFRDRLIDLGYTYTGTLATISVGPYLESRNYLDGGALDENIRGGHAELSWRVRPTWVVGAYARQENAEYKTIDRLDKTRYVGATLEKQWSRHWSTALDFTRYQRASSAAGQDVLQNSLYLSVAYRNR